MEEHKLKRKKQRALVDGNLEMLAYSCRKLGQHYSNCGRYEEALGAYKEEEASWEAQGKSLQVAVANRMIGEVYSNMGDFKKALIHQEKHLSIARAEASAVEEQRALATIGRTYFCLAESLESADPQHDQALGEAKQAYLTSLHICEQLSGISKQDQAEMKARLLLNIGLVLESQREVSRAVEYIQKAVGLCRCHDLFEDLYRCYLALGMVHHRQEDPTKALALLSKALDVAECLDNKALLSTEALLSKAEILFSLADFRGAKHALHKAYKLRTPNESERLAVEKYLKIAVMMCQAEDELIVVSDDDFSVRKKLYETLGDGCVAVKNYSKAIEFYLKMLECAEMQGEGPKSMAPAYVSLAQTYKDNRQYDKAVHYFRQELDVHRNNNPLEACRTCLNLADVLELQGADYHEVADMYRSALDLAAMVGHSQLQVLALRSLLSLQKTRRPDLAGGTELELQRILEAAGEDCSNSSVDGDDVEDETPNIADHICLDLLSDESASEGEQCDGRELSRKRPRLKVRRNEKGETQLHTACISGRLVAVRTLLEQGHPVNVRDHCGWLPIHEACNHGHKDIVSLLLDKGSAINDRGGKGCGGVTPLHDAASCGHLHVVELLLDRGALATARKDDGETPLDCLVGWYERAGKKMDLCDQLSFRAVQARLRKAMEKAGCHSEKSVPQEETSERLSQRKQQQRSRCADLGVSRHTQSQQLRSSGSVGLLRSTNTSSDNSDSGSDSDAGSEHSSSVVEGWGEARVAPSPVLKRRSPGVSAAAEEYAKTMNNLRHRHADQQQLLEQRTETCERVAFLASKEVGDDWLQDDVGSGLRPKKKRKHVAEWRNEFMAGSGVRTVPPAVVPSVGSSACVDPSTSHTSQLSSSTARRGPEVQRCQKSLLEAGFTAGCRESSQRADAECSGGGPAPCTSVEPPAPPALGIKVRVEELLFLVPVPHSPHTHTIGWLVAEVAQRCFQKKGMLPNITLMTKDGAMLSEEDPVSLVIKEEELRSSVASWVVPPVADIYRKLCASAKMGEDAHLCRLLAESQVSQSLQVSQLALQAAVLAPVFHALRHQSFLLQLHLAANCMHDHGLKVLADCLQTLPQLEVLDISCNNITSAGLAHLAQTSAHSLASLKVLNLGFNPLGDSGLKHLCALTNSLVSLKELVLTSCGFTPGGFKVTEVDQMPPLVCTGGVQRLDVSHNSMGSPGVVSFLTHLLPGSVQSLNLSYTAAHGSVAAEVSLFLEQSAPHSLLSLDMAGCDLKDAHVWQLTRVLVDARRQLQFLGLAHNPALTTCSLRQLLQLDVARSVDLRGCPGAARPPLHVLPVFRAVDPDTLLSPDPCLETLVLSPPPPSGDQDVVPLLRDLWHQMWGPRAVVSRSTAANLVVMSLQSQTAV